jgi:hypothetical protein
MSTAQLRQRAKKKIDEISGRNLQAAVAFIDGLTSKRPARQKTLSAEDKRKIAAMRRSIAKAEREYAEGRTVNWRTVRRDV